MAPPSATNIEPLTDTEAIFVPPPSALNIIASRRLKAGRLIAGTAAYTSSDIFKSTVALTKPKAKRWDHRLSTESKARGPSTLKGAAKHLSRPGLITLGGGLPCAENFPIEELTVKVPKAPFFSEEETKKNGVLLKAGKYDVLEGHGTYDLSIALNYGLGTGSAQMIRFVTEHTELVCSPPYSDWRCSLTVGSTSALDQIFRIFCERGDYCIAEEFTFSTAVETASPQGIKFLGVKLDDEGMIPSYLDDLLSNWDVEERGARKPFLVYTVPSGQNPTGATQSAERRHALYKIAQKHDLYIIEDEPYYFLQMQPYAGPGSPDAPPPASNEEFLKGLVPTYVSMDTDGRVIRIDSFSKVISPGSRCGWVTASEQIIEKYVYANECSSQNPSGLSQLVLYKLLDEEWGHDGYLKWLIHLRLEYTRRRNAILDACEAYLPRSVVSWNPPAAGMFLWLKVDHRSHPAILDGTATLLDLEEQIFLEAIEEGVLACKGSWFAAERDGFVPEELFFRTTFAAAPEDKMAAAIERFGIAIRKIFRIEN